MKHYCDSYVKALGRTCDRPAVQHIGVLHYCAEHDPYALYTLAAANRIAELESRLRELRKDA